MREYIDNAKGYFTPFDKRNRYRLALCTTVLGLGIFKTLYLKSFHNGYQYLPNKHISQNNSEGFYLSSLLSLTSSAIWILYSFLTHHIINKIAQSLKSDITKDIQEKWLSSNVLNYTRHLYPEVSPEIPFMLASGIGTYSDRFTAYTLGTVSRLIDFINAATVIYSITNKPANDLAFPYNLPNFIFYASISSTILISVTSFALLMRSQKGDRIKQENMVRRDAGAIEANALQIMGRRSIGRENRNLSILQNDASRVVNGVSYNYLKANHLKWLVTELSNLSSVIIISPMIFAKILDFQTDFIPMQREGWLIREFVNLMCVNVSTAKTFCGLNHSLYQVRTSLESAYKASKSTGVSIKHSSDYLLHIKKLIIYKQGTSEKLIEQDDPLTLQSGIYLLSAPNGAGKSTFLSSIMGLNFGKSNGHVYIPAKNDIIYVPQRIVHKNDISLFDLLIYPKKRTDYKDIEEVRGEALRLLKELGLDDFAKNLDQVGKWNEVSGGQMQMLALIQALLAKPKLLLLDEVTSAMSASIKVKAKKMIKEYSNREKAMVIHVEHSEERDNSQHHHYDKVLRIIGKKLQISDVGSSAAMAF